MLAGWRQAGPAGLGATLAVAFPTAVLAQILDAMNGDDDLGGALTAALTLVVCTGPVVGGAVVGRRCPRGHRLLAALVGGLAIAAIAAFGYLRLRVADEDPSALAIPVVAVIGGALALVGDGVGAAWAGRTRR